MPTSPATLECPDKPNLDMIFLRRFFKLMLDNTYSTSDNYGDYRESLKCLTTESGLSVNLDQLYDPAEDTQYSDSVNIAFGDIQMSKPAVNYDAGHTEDMSGRYFTTTCKLPLVIQHVSRHADMSYQLAHITMDAMFGLKEWIKNTLGLRGLSIATMSRPKQLDKSPDTYFSVEISVLLEFDYTVKSSIQSHRIKKFVTETIL